MKELLLLTFFHEFTRSYLQKIYSLGLKKEVKLCIFQAGVGSSSEVLGKYIMIKNEMELAFGFC